MIGLLERSLNCPEADLALDEALLESAVAGESKGDLLRLWELGRPTVVLGRGSRAAAEVNLAYCQQAGIPVLRRCSGGAAIMGGRGCLMYSLVLDTQKSPQLQHIDSVHCMVMERMLDAVGRLVDGVAVRGTCDLTFGPEARKFSGNSLRISRGHLLYHGTILYDADLQLISGCLDSPPRQPDYRRQRSHDTFLTNIPVSSDSLRRSIANAFDAKEVLNDWPEQRVATLRRQRYDVDAWNLRH